MEAALYHPEHGYYRRPGRDPFGNEGDFFTAEQLQPVFGILIAARIRSCTVKWASPPISPWSSWARAAERWRRPSAFPLHSDRIGPRRAAAKFRGVVFSNEFFDALPVHRVVWEAGEPRESRVGWSEIALSG